MQPLGIMPKYVKFLDSLCLKNGCPKFKQNAQNKVLYTFAHNILVHKHFRKCEICQKIVSVEIYYHHKRANCNDEAGIVSFAEMIRNPEMSKF